MVVASSPRSTPALELAAVEGEEVGALLPLDVDHLDELARAHLVRERGRGVDAHVEPGLGERRRELRLAVGARRRAPDLDEEVGGRRVAVDDAAGRGRDDDGDRTLRAERLGRARRRVGVEQPERLRLRRVEPARGELADEQAAVPVAIRLADDRRGRVRAGTERGGVVLAALVQHRDLGRLAAEAVDDGHPLVRGEREHRRAAWSDEVRLDERVLGEKPTLETARGPECHA